MSARAIVSAIAAAAIVCLSVSAAWEWANRVPAPTPLTLQFEPNRVYVYRVQSNLSQAAESRTAPTLPPGTFTLDATMAMRVAEVRNDGHTLAVSLRAVDQYTMSIDGHSRDANGASLLAGQVVVDIDNAGTVEQLYTNGGSHDASEYVLRSLLADIQMVIAPGTMKSQWTANQNAHFGDVEVRYRRIGAHNVRRERINYTAVKAIPWRTDIDELSQSVDSVTDIELSPRGHLHSVSRRESTAFADAPRGLSLALKAELQLELVRIESAPQVVPNVAALKRSRRAALLTEPPYDPQDVARRTLKARVGRFSFDDLVAFIRAKPQDTPAHVRNHQLLRAVGLLELHPELCERLIGLFSDVHTDKPRRHLILDLLVNTGHEVAQTTMINILRTARDSELIGSYGVMVQRLGKLSRPTDATAAFVRELRVVDDPVVRTASAYVMGSMVSRLDDREIATDFNDTLVEALRTAQDPDETSHLLRAIGNTRNQDNIEVVSGYADSSSAVIRSNVPYALLNSQTEQSEQLLLGLMGDSEPAVQATAMNVLRRYKLGPTQLEALANIIVADSLSRFSTTRHCRSSLAWPTRPFGRLR